jgi:ethanolaminephosphotransferase
MIYLGI